MPETTNNITLQFAALVGTFVVGGCGIVVTVFLKRGANAIVNWISERHEKIDAGLAQWADCHATVNRIELLLKDHGTKFDAIALGMVKMEAVQNSHGEQLTAINETLQGHTAEIHHLKKSHEKNTRDLTEANRRFYQLANKLKVDIE